MVDAEPAPPAGVGTWIARALGPAVLLAVVLVPNPLHHVPGAGMRPAYAAGVALWMAVWWFTEAVPIAATSCLPALYAVFGVFGQGFAGDLRRTAEPYGDAYILLFLGGMTLGAAMEEVQLHRRIALVILKAIGTDPARLLFGMLVATASISLWISNTATAVMMVPIGLALLSEVERRMRTEASPPGAVLPRYGAALLLAVAYAANVGGIGTKIGTATNSIFCGFLSEKLGLEIGFLTYVALAFPFVVLFLPVVWLVLWRFARSEARGLVIAPTVVEEQLRAMGPMTRGERRVAFAFGGAATLWILADLVRPPFAAAVRALFGVVKVQGKHYEATVAIAAALVAAALGTVGRSTLRRVPWSSLLLLGGSFAMAAGIEGSGLSTWLGDRFAVLAEAPPFLQSAAAAFGTVAVSAVASNTATVNLALNVLPPSLPVLVACAIAASCDFMLPAGTPPNAIVFGTRRVSIRTMVRIGLALDVLAAALAALYAHVWTPLILGR